MIRARFYLKALTIKVKNFLYRRIEKGFFNQERCWRMRMRKKRRKIQSGEKRKENTPSRHFVRNDDAATDAAFIDVVAAVVSIILSQNGNHTEHNLLAVGVSYQWHDDDEKNKIK